MVAVYTLASSRERENDMPDNTDLATMVTAMQTELAELRVLQRRVCWVLADAGDITFDDDHPDAGVLTLLEQRDENRMSVRYLKQNVGNVQARLRDLEQEIGFIDGNHGIAAVRHLKALAGQTPATKGDPDGLQGPRPAGAATGTDATPADSRLLVASLNTYANAADDRIEYLERQIAIAVEKSTAVRTTACGTTYGSTEPTCCGATRLT